MCGGKSSRRRRPRGQLYAPTQEYLPSSLASPTGHPMMPRLLSHGRCMQLQPCHIGNSPLQHAACGDAIAAQAVWHGVVIGVDGGRVVKRVSLQAGRYGEPKGCWSYKDGAPSSIQAKDLHACVLGGGRPPGRAAAAEQGKEGSRQRREQLPGSPARP